MIYLIIIFKTICNFRCTYFNIITQYNKTEGAQYKFTNYSY